MKNILTDRRIPVFLSLLVFSVLSSWAQSIKVYVSPPGNNTTNVVVSDPQTITTQAFSTTGTGWAATAPSFTTIAGLGKYYKISGTSTVIEDNQYGAGIGSYLAISQVAKIGIRLNEDKNYFGFAWCAGDAENEIQVYYKGQLLLTYTTANVISFLPKSPSQVITATDNSTYNSSSYYGKFSDTGTNPNEPYAYLHIYGSGGIVFDSLAFSQAAGTGTFETDNHSVVSGTLSSLPGTLTKVYEATAGTAASEQTICTGIAPADLTLTGSVGNIQWQVSANNSAWSNISGAITSTLTSATMGVLTTTRYYRAAVSSGSTVAYSNTIKITVSASVGGTTKW